MWKKIVLGIGLLLLFAGGLMGGKIWSHHEPYPAAPANNAPGNWPGSPITPELEGALDTLLTEFRARHHLPSVSLAVGLDDRVLYARADGFANLDQELPAGITTLYRIGSVSKPITTIALGRLMEEGLIDIDRDFRDYVPEFPEKQWPFTLRQLASHTAGIRHYVNPLENFRTDHYATVKDALVTIADDRLIFEPGTDFGYSSYGFNLLSVAMVAASETPFRDLLKAQVFEPMDMGGTLAEDPRRPWPGTAGFYLQFGERLFRAPTIDNSYKVAGGGLLGRPLDLVQLGNGLLAGRLLEPETFDLLTAPVALRDGSVDHGYGLGFGVRAVNIDGREVQEISHSGGSVGGLTSWKLFEDVSAGERDHDLVVAVTFNASSFGESASPAELAYQAADQVLDALEAGALASSAKPGASAPPEAWIELFNGENLDGWIPKVRGYPAGEDPLETFRVEEGKLVVSYENYEQFEDRFGHLFFDQPFSHYRLQLEYRFLGEPTPGTPGWAIRNSGAMLHSQAPDTMPADQDFPISVEFQFLGELYLGKRRATGNLCTPGTHVNIDGQRTEDHCIERSPVGVFGDGWVKAEATVLGDARAEHYIDNIKVIEYTDMVTGGGVVSGHDPAMKPEGAPLGAGYIALQSEGHRIEFRNIRLLNLKGCMNPHASNYAPWFEVDDPEACAY